MMERKEGSYSVNEVLDHVDLAWAGRKKKVDFDGDIIKVWSLRYRLFKEKGCKCVTCGMDGTYFVKERNGDEGPYHFNLYGIKDGEEMMMTKDHIHAKSKGGSNRLENLQPMCYECNQEKADTV